MAKPVVLGVSIQAKIDDALLGRSSQQIHQQTDRMATVAGASWADRFTKSAQVDPTKLASAAQFGQHGQKLGKSMGDSAADAMKRGDFQGAARDAAQKFSRTLELSIEKTKPKIDTSQMGKTGGTAGDEFASGFASAGGLMRLAGKGGPIAGAIIAAVTVATKTVKPMIEEAMRIDASIAQDQARLGASNSQMRDIRKAATGAWGKNSGASIEGNVSAAVAAMQSGLQADQKTIESLNTVATILGVEIPEAARSAGQLLRTGLASNAQQAFDIIVAGQREGLNVSGDWLDTLNEYSTQFRKLGLSGADAIGLMNQMVKAGARDTDKAADAIKEFSIRAIDGSKSTTDAYTTLGLSASDMSAKLAAGGNSARDAFGQVIDRIRSIKDPVKQMEVAVALMGTQAEDLGDAFRQIDLSTAAKSIKDVEGAAQSAADTALRTSQGEWAQAGRNIQKIWQDVKDSLNMGDWFSQVPKSFNELFADAPKLSPGAPGVPIWNGPGIGPPTTNGPLNPLDVIIGQHANGVPGTPPPAPPGPAPGQWWGPNMVAPPVNPRFGSQYDRADSKGGSSGGQSGPVVPFSGNAMDLLNGHPVNSSTFGAAQSLLEAQHKVAQESAELNAIMADNTATAEAITKARNELQAAETDQLQAQLRFNEAMTSAATGMAEGMQGISSNFAEIGANLDKDLGLSKGLPGLADNLVRFIASLAAAPIQGMLAPIANGAKGSGILGMLGVGQQGEATPAMQSYSQMPQSWASLPTSGLPQQYEKGMVPNNVNLLRDLEALFPGVTMNADTGRKDSFGEHGSGQALDIMVGQNQALGDLINGYLLANADRYGLQYNLWRQQQWNPDGTSSMMDDRGSPTQNHQDHVHARVSPGTPSPITQLPAAQPAPMAPQPGSTFPSSPLPAPGTVPTGGPLGTGFPTGFAPGLTPGYSPDTPAEQSQGGWQPQGGGQLGSGIMQMAMGLASGAAGMGANMFAPGSGAAAQAAADMAMKAINRTISYGGQVAGIAAQGLMETFGVSDPDGGGNGIGQSWFTRVAGSLAGARPAGGMGAGKADKESKVDPRNQQQGQQPQGGPQAPTVSIGKFVQAEGRDGERVINDIAYQTASAGWV